MSSATLSVPVGTLKSDATIISLVGVAHGTSHFFHLMLPPLFPWLMVEFGLGFAQVGLLMSVFFVVSGVGQAIAGIWVDRFGAHRVLYTGVALLTCSGVLVALAPNIVVLFIGAAVAGLGNSVFHPADFALLNKRVSTSRLGHAFSVHGIAGNLGWALAPVLMVALATAVSWRAAGWGAALFGALSLSLLIWKRDVLKYELQSANKTDAHVQGVAAPGSQGKQGFWFFLQVRMVWIAFAFFFFLTFGFGALQNFAPPLLHDLYGLSLASAASALTFYLLGGTAGLVLGGFLARQDSRHERQLAMALAGGALLALLLALAIVPGWLVLPIMAAMGVGVGIAGPSRDLLVRTATKARLGEGAFGRVYGMVYSGLDVGLAISPIVFGLLLDQQLPRMVFVGIAISLVIAIVVAVMLAREVDGYAPH